MAKSNPPQSPSDPCWNPPKNSSVRAGIHSGISLEEFQERQKQIAEASKVNMTDIDQILNERGKRYGEFKGHAKIAQALKKVMRETEGWERLSDSQKESLEMAAHKIGRILNGDPNYDDSWIDIGGYTKLVVDEIQSAS